MIVIDHLNIMMARRHLGMLDMTKIMIMRMLQMMMMMDMGQMMRI